MSSASRPFDSRFSCLSGNSRLAYRSDKKRYVNSAEVAVTGDDTVCAAIGGVKLLVCRAIPLENLSSSIYASGE